MNGRHLEKYQRQVEYLAWAKLVGANVTVISPTRESHDRLMSDVDRLIEQLTPTSKKGT